MKFIILLPQQSQHYLLYNPTYLTLTLKSVRLLFTLLKNKFTFLKTVKITQESIHYTKKAICKLTKRSKQPHIINTEIAHPCVYSIKSKKNISSIYINCLGTSPHRPKAL